MRQRFVKGIGGTLKYLPTEAEQLGVPSSPTISITHANGAALPTPVVGAVAAVDPATGELSYVLSGAQCPDPLTVGGVVLGDQRGLVDGHLYRAVWHFVIGTDTYESDQLYEVRRRILKSTLTLAEAQRDLPAPLLDLCDSAQDLRDAMGDAWDDVLDELAARGYEPDRVMDADRLRLPHRLRTLYRLSGKWGPQWSHYHETKLEEFNRQIRVSLEAGDWYDKIGDAVQQPGETRDPRIECTR